MAHTSAGKAESRSKAKQNAQEENVASKHEAPTSVQPVIPEKEPEDAHLTGARRSLQRRMLGLNFKQAQRHPDTPAGQHSTGSFTDGNEKKK
jgi:hypothetical protein